MHISTVMFIREVVFLALFWIANIEATCPNGFLRYENSCYKLVTSITATWAEAYMYCQLLQARLATIETDKEQQFIAGLLQREYQPGHPDGVWIGGTDFSVEGQWVWAGTGESIGAESYTHWFPGEPNSAHTVGEDCMDLLHHESYMWNDNLCSIQDNFLCEINDQPEAGPIG